MKIVDNTDKNDLYHLMHLEMSEEGRFLISYLEKQIGALKNKNATEKDDILYRWGQAHIQALSAMRDVIKTAREKLKDIEAIEKGPPLPPQKPFNTWV